MPEVFVNYRTGNGEKTATVIWQALTQRFGKDRIFRASASIRSGDAFDEALEEAVRRSSVLLAVIGPGWADSPGLREEHDWVRWEILEAFRCRLHVIPVLDGRRTERLSPAALPPELERLARCQSLRFDSQTSERDLPYIGDELADLVPALAAADTTRGALPQPESGSVANSVSGRIDGHSVQARDISGDVAGTVIKGMTGAVHTGTGPQFTNSPQVTGDGNIVAGTNHGGIRQDNAPRPRSPQDDDR